MYLLKHYDIKLNIICEVSPTILIVTPPKYDNNLIQCMYLVKRYGFKMKMICEVSPTIIFVTLPKYDDNLV